MPIFNTFLTVNSAVESVLNQTYKNLEIIIIDDCSTEDGIDQLEEMYTKDCRVKIIRLAKNMGVWNARNVGVQMASGRYIAFCDADDCWYSHKLTKQISFLLKHKAMITFSSYDIINAESNIIGQHLISKTKVNYHDMLYYNHIGNLTAVIDCKQAGKPKQENIHHEDYAMWLKLMNTSSLVIGIKEPLAAYRIHSKNLSGNKFKSLIWHFYVLKYSEKINVFKAVYYTLFGRLRLFYKRRLIKLGEN